MTEVRTNENLPADKIPAAANPENDTAPASVKVKPISPTPSEQIRPPLNRIDSRANLSPRTGGFPSQPPQFRPQSPNQQQPRPPFPGNLQFARPQPQKLPVSGQQVSSSPVPNVRPGTPNLAAQAAGLRQPLPFARPQLPPAGRPPGLLAQKSVPGAVSPGKQQEVTRSQTLDLTDSVSPRNVAESPPYAPKVLEEERGSLGGKESKEVIKKLSSESIGNVGRIQEEPRVVKQQQEEQMPRNKSPLPTGVKGKEEVVNQILDKEEEDRRSVEILAEKKQRSPTPEKAREVAKAKPVDTELANEPPQNAKKSPEPPKKQAEKKPEKPTILLPDSRNSAGHTQLLKSPTRSEGDNDSGVDESTQGNDQSSNGDHNSPRKSTGKGPVRNAASPTKSRSVSRGSKSPHVKTPESPTPSTPGSTDKKKVPMNKVHVGGAPSPNLKEIRSKIGSLQNTSYKPGGGQVKIESKKIDLTKAHSKVEAKNEKYVPGGGEKKIEHRKLNWNAASKIGSLENAAHKPKGGDKKIESVKLDFKDKAKPKVGSKDNIKHQPGGGDVKATSEKRTKRTESVKSEDIETKKVDIKAKSKVNSMDNMKHKPGGGDKKIFDDKDYLRQKSGTPGEHSSFNGSQSSLPSQEAAEPISDENLNRE